MLTPMKNLALLLFISLLLFSCRKVYIDPCELKARPSYTVPIAILDKETGRSLVGYGRTYNPDSISILNLENGSPNVFRGNFLTDTLILFIYPNARAGWQLPLRLSSATTDTVEADVVPIEQEGFVDFQINEFLYNGKAIERQEGLYITYKD